MKLSTLLAIGSALTLLYACSSDEQLFGDPPPATSSTTSDGGAGGSGGADGGMGGSGGSGGIGGAGGMGGMMDVCENEPMDSNCIVCLKRDCCSRLRDCRANMQCSCWLECREDGMSNFECISSCNGDAPEEFVDLSECAANQCSTQCQ